DVAVLEADPRLVQRPGAVHLDVALPDRRPRPYRIEAHHERERRAGEVVARARAREADLLAADARVVDRLGDDGDEHLDLVAGGLLAGDRKSTRLNSSHRTI